MTCIRAGVFRSKPTVDSMFILGCSLSLAFYFYLGFKGLCVKDKSFILDVLAWSPIIGALSSQEVRRGGRTKLVRWQLLDLKLMAKESGGKVEECGQGETEIQRAKDETESPAVVGWAVPCVTPQQRHLNCFFPWAENCHPHINNKNPKECPEKMSAMNENEKGEQAYRMEGIALIDRHLEISLELIKCCYLWGRREEGNVLLKHII